MYRLSKIFRIGKKALPFSLVLVSLLFEGCFSSNQLQSMPTESNMKTPTLITTAITLAMSRPPEIKDFLEFGISVSESDPLEFLASREIVEQSFTKNFNETYYFKRQSLVDFYKPYDASKLQLALGSLAKLTDWQYAEDIFDCSEMTALTEYALEAAGFDTLMISSLDPTGSGDPSITTGHAWCVVVSKASSGNQLIPIECTSPGYPQIPEKGKKSAYRVKGSVGYKSYDEYITKGWVLDDIYEATRYLQKEFDWWETKPINKSWFIR